MRHSSLKTGMILQEGLNYYLILGLFDVVVERVKQQIAEMDIGIINVSIDWVFTDITVCMLNLKGENVDFTKGFSFSMINQVSFYFLRNCSLVKTVNIDDWLLKNKMICPDLIGLMKVEEGIKELKKIFEAHKYRVLAMEIKKKSKYPKEKKVKSGQVVAIKENFEYRVFLVEDNRVLEFIKVGLSNVIKDIEHFDLASYHRVFSQVIKADEYYVLGELKC